MKVTEKDISLIMAEKLIVEAKLKEAKDFIKEIEDAYAELETENQKLKAQVDSLTDVIKVLAMQQNTPKVPNYGSTGEPYFRGYEITCFID